MKFSLFLDRLGIFLSSLCLVHCFLVPVALIFFPAFKNSLFADCHSFHFWFGFMVLSVVAFSFIPLLFKKVSKKPLLVALLGSSIIFISAYYHLHQEVSFLGISFELDHLFSILGSFVIIYAHYLRLKQNKGACCESKLSCDQVA